MELSILSQSDKLKIAVFLFAWVTDTLIRIEGQAVIDVFKTHNISSAASTPLDPIYISNLICNNISLADRNQIMREYYAGTLG